MSKKNPVATMYFLGIRPYTRPGSHNVTPRTPHMWTFACRKFLKSKGMVRVWTAIIRIDDGTLNAGTRRLIQKEIDNSTKIPKHSYRFVTQHIEKFLPRDGEKLKIDYVFFTVDE